MGGLAFRRIRPLLEDDDVSGFCSGNGDNDTWLKERARRAMRDGTARVYVLPLSTGEICGLRALGRLPARCAETPRTRFPARCLASLPLTSAIRGRRRVPDCCRMPFSARPRLRASLPLGRLSSTRQTSARRASTPTLGSNAWRATLVACSCDSSAPPPPA